jgi:lipopolysaccharide transport system ATP-binding protein
MSDTVIQVENLGKKYLIGHQQAQNVGLRHVLDRGLRSLIRPSFNRRSKQSNPKTEEFWALKDVSFEVQQGDRVGIIGRNGAGKSTLLKILSRITDPTTGRITLNGRVASLLEVGTGFHPELTGRENIYLNGAILGMSKAEIQRKFDEIVAFAEVEKFLDTPVKRYSSGMYVRLAFAVAAHLEPEILVVDEVLAVGDAQFQKKCLGKMEDVGKEGRTVLFVSHNMGTIVQLCNKALYFQNGCLLQQGDVNRIISQYLSANKTGFNRHQFVLENTASANKCVFFKAVTIFNAEKQESNELDVRLPITIDLEYVITRTLNNIELSIRIDTHDGRPVFTSQQSDFTPESLSTRSPGHYCVSIKIPAMFLMPGSYLLTIAAHQPMVEIYDFHEHLLSFAVMETGTKYAQYNQPHNVGIVMIDLPWQESKISETLPLYS